MTIRMLHDVIDVKPRANFRLWIRFEDGIEGEVDLSDLPGRGVFKRWADDPSEFDQVSVDSESGTVVWPGGLDVAPDRLYRDITSDDSPPTPVRHGRQAR